MKNLILISSMIVATIPIQSMAEEYKIIFEAQVVPFENPYDSEGFNYSTGEHRDTGTVYDENGYDVNGYDVNGFDSGGIHNITGTEYDSSGYNVNGYNIVGFSSIGIHKDTGTEYDSEEHDVNGIGKETCHEYSSNYKYEQVEYRVDGQETGKWRIFIKVPDLENGESQLIRGYDPGVGYLDGAGWNGSYNFLSPPYLNAYKYGYKADGGTNKVIDNETREVRIAGVCIKRIKR
jgi:hypothetical protein